MNGAYANELSPRITPADLAAADPRITKQVEWHFRQQNISGGKFSHYKPAAYFLREQIALLPHLAGPTLDHIEELFKRINALLP